MKRAPFWRPGGVWPGPVLALMGIAVAAAAQSPAARHGAPPPAPEAPAWIIRNARIVRVEGPPIERASVLVRDGVIQEVSAGSIAAPDAREFDATGLTLYPGLIDLYTTLGQPNPIPAERGPRNPPQPMATAADHLRARPAGITPSWRVATVLQWEGAEGRSLAAARSAGVTLALSVPRQGAIPGAAAVLRTAGAGAEALPAPDVAPVFFQFTGSRGAYPSTLMGVLAAQRQALLDAAHPPQEGEAPDPNLEALRPLLRGEQAAFFVAGREREIRRALALADEFRLRPVLVGGEEASLFAGELRARDAAVLFGLGKLGSSPAAGRPDPVDTPAALLRAGVPVALTSQGLASPAQILPMARRLLAAGVSEAQVLRALTLTPAEILGLAHRFGEIAPGRSADLLFADGALFAPGTRIRQVCVAGRLYPVEPPAPGGGASARAAAGGTNVPGGTSPAPAAAAAAQPPSAPQPPPARTLLIRNGTLLTVTRGVLRNGSILVRDGRIVAIGPAASLAAPPDARVIDATGRWVMPGIVDAHSHMAIEGGINEGTYSITPEVRIRDVLNPKDVTIYRALAGGVTTAHVMHGSANVIGGQNAILKLKWGRPLDEMLPRDAPRTVKFALGENPKRSNAARPTGAPGASARYPTTRMGIEHLLRECFTAARAYQREWDAYRRAVAQASAGGPAPRPPRRDLRLEALADILAGRILVQAHSYRADEILMLLRLAEEFGFRIRTLHHALEAYKVAPEIARHGAGVSTFSDWWAYKVEAFDAIPHNAALCARAGIRVSVNSDSNEQVRRLYWEAAKTMKYGGMSETDALKTITLWPAWQIGMEHRIGSLEVGKDADIAIFSAHPFSPAAVCEMTLVEGVVYFDRNQDRALRGKPGYPAPDAEAALNIGQREDGCGCDD